MFHMAKIAMVMAKIAITTAGFPVMEPDVAPSG
jgi:hypothetical protein